MPAALSAAHVAHEIEHSNAFMGFLIGAAVGLAVGAAIVAAAVAAPVTGGASLLIVAAVGGAIATTGGAALVGAQIGSLSKNPKGPIVTGTGNVFYGPGRISAARAVIDTVACKDHGTKRIAQGSDSVFINTYPAVRDSDKTECDGDVKSNFDNIFIGAETATYLEIDSEIPGWMLSVAEWMVIGGTAVALLAGGAFAFIAGGLCGLASFGLVTALSFAGSIVGGIAGGAIGEALGGEKGGIIGNLIGSFAGGLIGGRGGLRLSNRYITGHPIDVATGEMFTSEVDFTITGLVPIAWERFWISGSEANDALGWRWHHPLDGVVVEGRGDYALWLADHGRTLLLPKLQPGQCYYHRSERVLAIRDDQGWTIRDSDDRWHAMVADANEKSRFLLKEIRDANGNRVTIRRDASGAIDHVTGSDGIEYLFRNDDAGRIRSIHRRAGLTEQRLVSYDYDQAGDLVAVTDAEGATARYSLNAHHLIERETHRSGYSWHFRWDVPAKGSRARCIETYGDDGSFTRRLSYDLAERTTTETDGEGRVTQHWWNEAGLVTRTLTPMGHEFFTDWNVYAERLSVTDAMGAVTRMGHDEFGRQITHIAADGSVTLNRYASDEPTDPRFFACASVTDAAGAETQFTYDPRGNAVSMTDALGPVETLMIDERGLPLVRRDDQGVIQRLTWTAEGRLAAERNSAGGRTTYSYDRFGRLIGENVEGEAPRRYDFDASDRPIRLIEGDGSTTLLTYDTDGNLASHTDPLGHRTRWEFAGFGLVARRTNADGTRLHFRYDSELNLTGIANELGEVYAFDYDDDQRLVAETQFDGRRIDYDLDPAGRVLGVRDGRREHRLERDVIGRLTRRMSSDGIWARFSHDRIGRLIAADTPERSVAFAYDLRGGLVREVQDGLAQDHVLSPRGQRTATILPDGRVIRYDRDADDALTAIRLDDRQVVTIDRDRLGRETQRRAGEAVMQTDYDPQGRIARQMAWRAGVTGPVFGRRYDHAPDGTLASVDDLARGQARYAFDARDRLRELTGPDGDRFAFDPAGRLLGGTEAARGASVVGGRLLMQGDRHYRYDDAGNRIEERRGQGGRIVTRFDYDDLNQLVAVRESAGRRVRETRFAYDALGRRVWKHYRERFSDLDPANDAEAVADVVTRDERTDFLWSGDVLLAESRTDLKAEAQIAADPLAVLYLHEPGSFRPAAQIRRHSREAEGEILAYWLDRTGTPLEITNENGEIVWQVALKAWGGIGRVLVDRAENPIRFQGQYHDIETGLHYNRHRHYDPEAGWYLSSDPLGIRGGMVQIGYVGDPTGWIDPLGLAGCPSITSKRQHHNNTVDSIRNSINAMPNRVAVPREMSIRGSGIPGRTRPDIAVFDSNGRLLHFVEVKTGQAGLTPRQTSIYPQIRNGNAIPTGSVARDYGLKPGVPLNQQGYPNGIPVYEVRYP
ncbi:DUF6531 domain-containing protein [Paracoccus sp. TK19116]|uniref:DUF6531 domain-containing protein n=1 Tax=Paracoccus albicereus TaxID=2922394 RepID=A0ABT1MRA5_9RHOB|nr:RHS repeat-associated core domain-containing protein [Paracoccus albicereus]MCQ0970249.1 DUF6531 domain-containing protein [Paracoccus albicereus]